MSAIPYKLLGVSSLVPFTLLILSMLVLLPTPTAARFKPSSHSARRFEVKAASKRSSLPQRPRGFKAVSAKSTAQIRLPPVGVPTGGAKVGAGDIAKSSGGPAFTYLSLSDFFVRGLVRGDGWVVAIHYELEEGSVAAVTITAEDVKQPFVIPLTPTNDGPAELIRELPQEFGKKPRVGVLSFQAFKSGPGERKEARFFLHGLGVGLRANVVGSMVVDQIQFRPGSIRPSLEQKAAYSFRSLSDFDTVSADFMLVTLAPDGVVRPVRVKKQTFKHGVRRGETVAKEWDGKNSKGKISRGPHQLHVGVWRGLKRGADWVFAATRQIVRVEP